MSVARFIADQRTMHRVPHAVCCAILGVSVSWFYKWVHREPTPTEVRRGELDAAVRAAFEASKRTSVGRAMTDAEIVATFEDVLRTLRVDDGGLTPTPPLSALEITARLCADVKRICASAATPEQMCLHRLACATGVGAAHRTAT